MVDCPYRTQHADRPPQSEADHSFHTTTSNKALVHLKWGKVGQLAYMLGADAAASALMASAASAAVGRSCGFNRRHCCKSSIAPFGHSSGTLQAPECLCAEDRDAAASLMSSNSNPLLSVAWLYQTTHAVYVKCKCGASLWHGTQPASTKRHANCMVAHQGTSAPVSIQRSQAQAFLSYSMLGFMQLEIHG